MIIVLKIWPNCGQGGGGPKNPKICVTSLMDGPLAKMMQIIPAYYLEYLCLIVYLWCINV